MSTKIEWCEESWNPITGCTPISEGCEHCYARRMSNRLRGRFGYPEDDPFRVTFHEDRLDQPEKWWKPRMIFVCSMGDLFHEDVQDEWINRIFTVMTHPLCGGNHHIYLLLTKRPERILRSHLDHFKQWPNIWLGVTAENQKRYDERWEILKNIPASVRFISFEPLLGPVEIRPWGPKPDWVILGGETGPGARPMHPDWVRKVRDDCVGAGVPFFFKSWGEYGPEQVKPVIYTNVNSNIAMDSPTPMYKVGKKRAGRLLDGREWNTYPNQDVGETKCTA